MLSGPRDSATFLPSISLHFSFLKQGVSMNPELTQDWLPSKPQGSPCLQVLRGGIRGACSLLCLAYSVGAREELILSSMTSYKFLH